MSGDRRLQQSTSRPHRLLRPPVGRQPDKGEERIGRCNRKSAMRKVYMRLLSFAILSYFLAYIDRINVSFAELTMRGDLDI